MCVNIECKTVIKLITQAAQFSKGDQFGELCSALFLLKFTFTYRRHLFHTGQLFETTAASVISQMTLISHDSIFISSLLSAITSNAEW